MTPRRIGVFTTDRADYGILRPILRRLRDDSDLETLLYVTGSHLSRAHGRTVEAIEADGFEIRERFESLLASDRPEGVARTMALTLQGAAQALARELPDLVLLVGDRAEIHATASAAVVFGVPIAHLHGGERSSGSIDDLWRPSITKMSHLHFVSTENARLRVLAMGESPERIVVSGAPSLDEVTTIERLGRDGLRRRFGVPGDGPFLLVTFHPATRSARETPRHVAAMLEALREISLPIVWTRSNADVGGAFVNEAFTAFGRSRNDFIAIDSLGTAGYFSVMAEASCMVGNSSSGIIEAASFGLPVVNVGDRQDGRERSRNVIDVGCDAGAIVEGVRRATSAEFREGLRGLENVYGDGRAAERIVSTIERLSLDDAFLRKAPVGK